MTQKKENKIINDKKKAKNTVKAKQSTKKVPKVAILQIIIFLKQILDLSYIGFVYH